MAHPLAQRLSAAFISCFWSADRELTWTSVETEHQLWLTPHTLLVGRVDAQGIDGEGNRFFGEWKTLSSWKARDMERVKAEWRMNPQSLTYGVLVPNTRRFTVRWAIKPDKRKPDGPIKCDFEWYTYTHDEVAHWRQQLISIADDIRRRRQQQPEGPWRTNYDNCMKYGPQYACPFMDTCHKLDFNATIGPPRIPHLDFEREFKQSKQDAKLVILDATRADLWLECEERYRRSWEGVGVNDEGEALVIGSEFHDSIHQHIGKLIRK